jgi:hypothetical protein
LQCTYISGVMTTSRSSTRSHSSAAMMTRPLHHYHRSARRPPAP